MTSITQITLSVILCFCSLVGQPVFAQNITTNDLSVVRPPIDIKLDIKRKVFIRNEPPVPITIQINNLGPEFQRSSKATLILRELPVGMTSSKEYELGILPIFYNYPTCIVTFHLPTQWKQGAYELVTRLQSGQGEFITAEHINRIWFRPAIDEDAMPVLLWGTPRPENYKLAQFIGFTHFISPYIDYSPVWENQNKDVAMPDADLSAAYDLMDKALRADLRVFTKLNIGLWMRKRKDIELYRTRGRAGMTKQDNPIAPSLSMVQQFGSNVGRYVANSFGEHPGWVAALINTEERSSKTQASFTKTERNAFTEATGLEIPTKVNGRTGEHARAAVEIAPGVVNDKHPIYRFYEWFWKSGDGWNDFNSAISDGIKSVAPRIWTFHDPAVRTPSIWGSGGNVDYISQWTYTNPEPTMVGLAAEELLAMADGTNGQQQIMNMTQLFWYRSLAIGKNLSDFVDLSRYIDIDPDVKYISISPSHLRQAFWSKIARPVKGIMYHGWNSLVGTDDTNHYRYTHDGNEEVLKELIHEIIQPLGPMLKAIPAKKSKVVLLESFSSQVFAKRGTWGWGKNWVADAWLLSRYAHLQPAIVYEETILRDDLHNIDILILPSCDLLPKRLIDMIIRFQRNGGIVVGDKRLTPALQSDINLPVFERSKNAQRDSKRLKRNASLFKKELDVLLNRHSNQSINKSIRPFESSNDDVLTYHRSYDSTDYLFLINDKRRPGTYVGQHNRVLETGVPVKSSITINQNTAFIYDLRLHRLLGNTEISNSRQQNKSHKIDVNIKAGDGTIWMITPKKIHSIDITSEKQKYSSQQTSTKSIELTINVRDNIGNLINAVLPMKVDFKDPHGKIYSSKHIAAIGGTHPINWTPALNDTKGTWTIMVTDLASGNTQSHNTHLN